MGVSVESAFLLDDDEREFFEAFLTSGKTSKKQLLSEDPSGLQADDVSVYDSWTSPLKRSERSKGPSGIALMYDDDIRGLGLEKRVSTALVKANAEYAGMVMRVEHEDVTLLSLNDLCNIRSAILYRARAMPSIGCAEKLLEQYLTILSPHARMTFDPFGFARPIQLARGLKWTEQPDAVHLVTDWVSRNGSRLHDLRKELADASHPICSLTRNSPVTKRLFDSGIQSVYDLAHVAESDLIKIRGIGEAWAKKLIKEAHESLQRGVSASIVDDFVVDDALLGSILLSKFDETSIDLAFSEYESARAYGFQVAEIPFLLWTLPMAEVLLTDSSKSKAYDKLRNSLDWFRFDGMNDGEAHRPSSVAPALSGPIDLEEWVCGDYLSPRERMCLSRRLNGETIQSIGDRLGLSRERVRQIVRTCIEKRPPIKQDAFLRFLHMDGISDELFIQATGESARTLAYLRFIDGTGETRKNAMASDRDTLRRVALLEKALNGEP